MSIAVVAIRASFVMGVLGLVATTVSAFQAQDVSELPTDDDLPPQADYDCVGTGGDGPHFVGTVRIGNNDDQYNLDGDGDGLGCEGFDDSIIPLGASDTDTTVAPVPSSSAGVVPFETSGAGGDGGAGREPAGESSSAGPGLLPFVFVFGAVLLVGGAAWYVMTLRRDEEGEDEAGTDLDAYPQLWEKPEDPVDRYMRRYDEDR